jgi:hypothetical protein
MSAMQTRILIVDDAPPRELRPLLTETVQQEGEPL